MFIGPCVIAIVDEWKTNLMSLAILFHLLCAQHISDISISIFRSLRLCWRITTSVVLFSVRCVLELLLRLVFGFAGFSLQNEHHQIPTATKAEAQLVLQPAKRTQPNTNRNKSSNTQRTENKTTDVVIHQHSRKLLKMDILMSETCWAHNKWNKIARDIKLVFHSSKIRNIQHTVGRLPHTQLQDIICQFYFQKNADVFPWMYLVWSFITHSSFVRCYLYHSLPLFR